MVGEHVGGGGGSSGCGGGELRLVCLEKEVCGQEPQGGHAGQSSSRRSWSRLEGPGSEGEANLFHLAEQRPE